MLHQQHLDYLQSIVLEQVRDHLVYLRELKLCLLSYQGQQQLDGVYLPIVLPNEACKYIHYPISNVLLIKVYFYFICIIKEWSNLPLLLHAHLFYFYPYVSAYKRVQILVAFFQQYIILSFCLETIEKKKIQLETGRTKTFNSC